MKKLVILIFSMVMAGEMEVDGNLTVTDTLIVNNKDVNATIDSLLSLIAQLEIRIAQLECQNTGIIPDGYCDCFFHTLDECGVCNGDTTSCQDCAGVLNGDNLQDMCGYCDNDSSNDCAQDCFGEWGGTVEVDQCGICGGTCDTWCGCDSICEAVEDVCGDCGGEAESEDDCVLDYALYFNGNEKINIPHSPTLNTEGQITVEIWCNPDNFNNNENYLISKSMDGQGWNRGWAMRADGGGSSMGVEMKIDGAYHYFSADNSSFEQNSWSHRAFTYDGNTLRMFINGNEIASHPISGNIDNNGYDLTIGYVPPYSGYFWYGSLDKAIIWNSARTEEEIQSTMYIELTGSEPDLVGYWNFNEGIGSTLNDLSGNGNHGIIDGATWVER